MSNYDTIRLEKGMYAGGNSLTHTLEELDPSENYRGTALEGLDAYQRQLKRFGIHVSGPGSDAVEKFFQTSDSAALFPEYVSRAVRQGLEEANVLPRIIASTTKIDGMDYRTITSVPEEDDRSLKHVAEGAFIPQTTVKTQEISCACTSEAECSLLPMRRSVFSGWICLPLPCAKLAATSPAHSSKTL